MALKALKNKIFFSKSLNILPVFLYVANLLKIYRHIVGRLL